MAGRKPTPINLKSTSPEGVVRTFKSIPEAAIELGFSEAAVKKAKYSNRNRIGEYQLEWLEPKPEKPAFNRLERVKSNKTKNCFICEEPLETEDKMDHFSIEELNSKGEIIQTHYPSSLYRAAQISGISWNALTLRAPRVLVPTPSTKGGGGSKRTPPVSQEREMLQT